MSDFKWLEVEKEGMPPLFLDYHNLSSLISTLPKT